MDRTTNKYDLHPIVRRYAYKRLTVPDRTGAHERLVDYFEAVPKSQEVNSLEDLAPIIELYHHMVRAGNLDEAKQIFKDRLDSLTYYQFGAYQLQIELLQSLFPDGEDKPPRLKNEITQGQILNDLASVHSLSGQSHRAVPIYENAVLLAEKIGSKRNIATALGNVAYDQLKIGLMGEAGRNLRRHIDLSREIEDEGVEGTGPYEHGKILAYAGQ